MTRWRIGYDPDGGSRSPGWDLWESVEDEWPKLWIWLGSYPTWREAWDHAETLACGKALGI